MISRRTLLLVALAGCAEHTPPPPLAPAPKVTTTAAAAPSSADVSVELRAKGRVRWVPTTLGPDKPTLGVVVVNRSSAPLDVENLRVRLDAVREGVSFRCAKEVGASAGAREPKVLEPSASFTFERTLDCALPLVGSYAVRVSVSFGRGEWSTPRELRAFTMSVFAAPEVAPRAIDPVPGLWGAVGASSVLMGETAGGPGRIVVSLVNGGRVPLELPRFKLSLRVFRVDTPIPCESEPTDLNTPAVLGAGAAYHETLPVSCLGLDVAGSYDIHARLRVGEDIKEIDLGRLRVEISNDPTRRLPLLPSSAP